MTISPSSIPEAAVDAAFAALFPKEPTPSAFKSAVWEPTIKTILEAAAPHMVTPEVYVSVPCARCGEPSEQLLGDYNSMRGVSAEAIQKCAEDMEVILNRTTP